MAFQDCISFLECQGTGTSPSQRCKDAPYLSDDAMSMSSVPPGIVLPTPRYRLEDELN